MVERAIDIMTIEDSATYLKISKPTLYKLTQQEKLPGSKAGRHWRFHKDAVDDWLKNNSTEKWAARS